MKKLINVLGLFCLVALFSLGIFQVHDVSASTEITKGDFYGLKYSIVKENDEYVCYLTGTQTTDIVDRFTEGERLCDYLETEDYHVTKVVCDMVLKGNANCLFSGCYSLQKIDFKNIDTSAVTNMERMFSGCNMELLDVSSFNTKNVTNMVGMFEFCDNLIKLDLSSFDTKNVTNMALMFSGCNKLETLNISNFNTSNVTNMGEMFSVCSSLKSLDVSKFDTSKVTNMLRMFGYCESLTSLDVSNFDTSKVKNFAYIFRNCYKLTSIDTSSFDVSSANTIGGMFEHCTQIKEIDISHFDVSNVYDFHYLFLECTNLEKVTMKNWNALEGTTLEGMFMECEKLKMIDMSGCVFPALEWGEDSVFFDCVSLHCIKAPKKLGINLNFPEGATLYQMKDGVVTDKAFTKLPAGNSGSIVLVDPKSHVKDKSKEKCDLCGFVFMDHKYANPQFTWSKDGKKCSVTYTCSNDASHKVTYSCKVTSKVKTAATCTKKGTTTYTATYGSDKSTKDVQDISVVEHKTKDVITKATTKADGKIEVKCSVCNKVTKTTAIKKIKSVTLKYTSTTYTGKELKPTVTVKDSAGKAIASKYYTITYKKNKNVGEATVEVKFKGNYSGTISKTFSINPKTTKVTKLEAKTKAAKVTWTKLTTQTTGYEVQVATDNKFTKNVKKETITKNTTTSKTISGLKAKTKYYVRVRTYKTVDGKKYYSGWVVYKNTVKTK